jgi:hypothetical protein
LGLALLFIGAVLRWRYGAPGAAGAVWLAAAAIVALYYLLPPARRPIYFAWSYTFSPLGWAMSHVVLAIVYFLVFTPVGLVRRLLGYDRLGRRIDRSAVTYWSPHRSPADHRRYFRQF